MNAPDPAGLVPTLAERLAAAISGCASVARLHGGPFGEVATYLPGRQVTGIRISGDDTATDPALVGKVAVHVAGRYPHPISEIVRDVRAAATGILGGLTVEVTVEDYL